MISMTSDPRLAELLASRICHDLGAPVSGIGALVPQAAQTDAQLLLKETAEELRFRLTLFAAAFGQGDDRAWNDLPRLLAGAPMAHRVRFDVVPSNARISAAETRILLAAALLAAEGLPRGGAVRIAREEGGIIAVAMEGRDAEWSPALIRLLSGGSIAAAIEEGPRHVLAPWLFAQAGAAGAEISLAVPVGVQVPPLLLGLGA
ncbi:histidine phosphotransferase family protein [Roseococcus sp. YIM B11640]|uniref:histidine phosphotransferase family protein n=1 Tax=Roseococcus sp. YIM B11640 TaxID=3133973 RepID=UPI003C7BC58A